MGNHDLYQLVDLDWCIIDQLGEELVVFWPVLRKPGRQRRLRMVFDHPSDASVYGLKVQKRYMALVGKDDENTMGNVFGLIRDERERQNQKWGQQNHDDYRWLAILAEEVGELSQAILHDEFGGSHAGTTKGELVQVAAVAVQWLECMERRKVKGRVP